jgi:hypothetical protein
MSRKTRKLIWSVPLVAALAIVGALAAFMVLAPGGALAHAPLEDHGLPGPVTELEATAKSRSSIQLTWEAPADGATPTGYRIDYSENNRVWQRLLDENEQEVRVGHPDTSLLITWGVNPDTQRHYRVFAYNDAGDGPVGTNPVTDFVDVTEDGHPALAPLERGFDLVVKASGSNKLLLNWTAPQEQGAPVTGYRVVEMLEQSGADDPAAVECADGTGSATPGAGVCLRIESQDPSDRTAEHPNLLAGDVHYYRVIALTASAGNTATDIEGARTASARAPSPPLNPVAVPLVDNATSDDAVELYWNKPASDGGVATLTYEVEGRTRLTDDDDWPQGWNDEIGTSPRNGGDAFNLSITPSEAIDGQWQYRIRTVQVDDDTAKAARQLKGNWVYFNSRSASNIKHIVVPDPVATVDTNVPLQPTTLTGTPLDAQTSDKVGVRLTWVPSTETGPQVDSWRLDASDNDGVDWVSLDPEIPFHDDGFNDFDAKATVERQYRILPINSGHRGPGQYGTGTATASPLDPSQSEVFTLEAEGTSSTVIQLTWPKVTGAVDYDISYAGVGDESGLPVALGSNGDVWTSLKMAHTSTTYDHKSLSPGDEYWYRVVPQAAMDRIAGTGAAEARGQTKIDVEPGTPWNLTVELAKNSNFKYTSRRGVLLLWDAPDDKSKASPTGYQLERQVDGGAWKVLVDDTDSPITNYTDDEEDLPDDEWRSYRVSAISGNVVGDPSNEAAIGHTLAIAASTLDATASSATQIDLSWTIGPPATVPASVINRIDYFIVERAYGDVMFLDDERTDDDAFTDAESWWNGLECAGMVAAVNDDGEAVSSNPFCKMYDGLADADETTVDEYFAKRYAIIDNDFALPPMMSYMDMNLMADTEYSYRLRAVYQLGVSDWSETAMATPQVVSTALTAPSDVTANGGSGMITVAWTPGMNATAHVAFLWKDGARVGDLKIIRGPDGATADFTGLDAGTYTVVVLSYNKDNTPRIKYETDDAMVN